MRQLFMAFALLLTCMLARPVLAQEPITVVRYAIDNPDFTKRYDYPLALLEMALEASAPAYGPYRIERASFLASQQRLRNLVEEGEHLDITFGMSRPEIESRMRVVPFPLMKGLLGYRVMLTRPDLQSQLEDVNSLADLSRFVAVQGDQWTDTQILQANGLPVETSSDYPGMFRMLKAGRVDYFPRSIAEVWAELEEPLAKGLTLNQKVVLRYPGPFYFFVSRNNPELAERLHAGLMTLHRSGQFEAFFRSRMETRNALAFLETREYRLLDLVTPFDLPSLEQIPDSLWLSPEHMEQ